MSDYRERACTCHPDKAPRPCPQRYAYSECVLAAEIERLHAERDELLAALRDMIEISKRNSEATLMLIAIRKCAEHAIAKAEGK